MGQLRRIRKKKNYSSDMLIGEVSTSKHLDLFLVTTESGYIEGEKPILVLLSLSQLFSNTYKLTGSEIFVFF